MTAPAGRTIPQQAPVDPGRIPIAQRPAAMVSGWYGVLAILACGGGIAADAEYAGGPWALLPVVALVLVATTLVVVTPGSSQAVQFFGSYVGTVSRPGFWCVLPLTVRRRVSLRVRNFETNHLKVNDADGNPIDIAAIIVWQVKDTARATYAVDDYGMFIRVQAEAALRHVANAYPYDTGDDAGRSLRGSTDQVADELAGEVAERVAVAGLEIAEVRISHLAYSPEIAQAMLRRQQANAVVNARTRIVEGAVGMVEMALTRLTDDGIVALDEERTAAMVSNLMVVLCGDQPAAPVVNTGSLYT